MTPGPGVSTVGHTFYKHMFQLVPEARKLRLGVEDDGGIRDTKRKHQWSLQIGLVRNPGPLHMRIDERLGMYIFGVENTIIYTVPFQGTKVFKRDALGLMVAIMHSPDTPKT